MGYYWSKDGVLAAGSFALFAQTLTHFHHRAVCVIKMQFVLGTKEVQRFKRSKMCSSPPPCPPPKGEAFRSNRQFEWFCGAEQNKIGSRTGLKWNTCSRYTLLSSGTPCRPTRQGTDGLKNLDSRLHVLNLHIRIFKRPLLGVFFDFRAFLLLDILRSFTLFGRLR